MEMPEVEVSSPPMALTCQIICWTNLAKSSCFDLIRVLNFWRVRYWVRG